MFKVPLQDVISKIKQEKGISEDEINSKIDAKLEQLSGLISREGAAHIIANELGVKVLDQVTGRIKVEKILSGMRNVETAGKAVNVYELREFQNETRSGKVASLVLGDETGTIRVVMWGDQAENINNIKQGNTLLIEGAYVRESNGRKELHLNDRSNITVNPQGIEVGEVKQFPKSERKQLIDLKEGDENIELLGTIVQTFDPRFFEVCSECGKRMRQENGVFLCPNHPQAGPDYSYVLNLALDDGTENIRAVFFKNQLEKLVGKSKDDLLKYKDNPAAFEEVKTDLLGKIVKVIGRVNKNQMFDRLEFVAQLVFPDPDPSEELDKVENAG